MRCFNRGQSWESSILLEDPEPNWTKVPCPEWRPGRGEIELMKPALDLGDPFQRRIPPQLEFARNQSVIGIDGFVAATGEVGLIAGLLAIPTPGTVDDRAAAAKRLGRVNGGFDCIAGYGAQDSFDTASSTAALPKLIHRVPP